MSPTNLGYGLAHLSHLTQFAPNHTHTRNLTEESGKSTVGENPTKVTECGGKLCFFEEMFLKSSFYSGEHKLDRVLISLLKLSECCISERDPMDPEVDYLINRENFQRTIQNQTDVIKQSFKREKKLRGFSYLSFASRFKLRLCDKVSGIYPMKFQNYRQVIHALKLSWSLYLTMKMKKVDLRCRLRYRGDRFRLSSENSLSVIFSNILRKLRKGGWTDEKRIIKLFKTSLCYDVSVVMRQSELPEGDRIELLPVSLNSNIRRLSWEDQVNLRFSFLQAKSLCERVPESFVQETLEKHRLQLSSPHRGVSENTLKLLEEEGRIFGKIVKRYYQPEKGFFPTNKATFQFPRNVGGMKGDLVFHNRLTNETEEPIIREEPLVVGLFGQPGQGKSLLLVKLINFFKKFFPGKVRKDLCYMRTSNVKHWDGYTGQPIVVLDDLGQSRAGSDIQEFQTLVSCNPYVLPMAGLPEKGTKFSSPVIIATSNIPYGHQLANLYEGTAGIVDPRAFWRRFHLPLLVEDQTCFRLREEPIWFDSAGFVKTGRKSPFSKKILSYMKDGNTILRSQFNCESFLHHDTSNDDRWVETPFEQVVQTLSNLYLVRKKFHQNHSDVWTQVVIPDSPLSHDALGELFYEEQLTECRGTLHEEHINMLFFGRTQEIPETRCSLSFDAYPPDSPLEVRVEPIVEPLKVRTITAGRGDLFCLKPLQRAMWKALGDFPQYCLTHGTQNLVPAITRIFEQSSEEDVWISGDYSAATDSFDIEASKALMRGILESIDHEPTRRWAMKELSPHLLFYPKRSGLKPVLQKSGQLMGSFLSFPLLCLLNNATAKFAGLQPHQYLINGDDILMRAPPDVYPIWKKQVEEFGLDLSLGKNYVSKFFGTVNSQLIHNGEVQCSGKQRLLDRRVQVLGECLRDLELQMDEDTPDDVHKLFISVNRKKLSRTVRSVRVPVSHGGLGLSWGTPPKDIQSRRTEILVYLHDLFKKITPMSGHICFPYLSIQELEEMNLETQQQAFNEPVSNKEFLEDFLCRPSIQKISERCKNHPSLRSCLFGKSIEDLPPLNFIQIKQIPFKSLRRSEVQKTIDSMFLDTFLNYKGAFNYRLFRERILMDHLGIKKEEPKHEYLFNLCDLEFSCRFLDEIDYRESKALRFNSTLFQKQLGSDLKPKDFYIPNVSSEDYQADLLESVETILALPESRGSMSNYTESVHLMIQKDNCLNELIRSHDRHNCSLNDNRTV